MKSKIIFILALAAMVFLAAGTMGATDYYVATTGNNGGTGSEGDPWLTIIIGLIAVLFISIKVKIPLQVTILMGILVISL